MTRVRRVRCTGPLCAPLKSGKQLHPRGETIRLPDGMRVCTPCALELGREGAPEAALSLSKRLEQSPNTLPDAPLPSTPVTLEADLEESLRLVRIGEKDVLVPADALDAALNDVREDDAARREALGLDVLGEGPFLPAPTRQVDLGDPLAYTRFPDVTVEGWPLRKGRLSAGALSLFLTCPEKFRRKQVHGERIPSGGKGVIGGAAHKAVEAAYRHYMEAGTLAPPQLWGEWLDARFDRDLENDGVIDWGRKSWGEKQPLTADQGREQARVVAGTYIRYIAPTVQPVGVEEGFVTWVSGCPVPLVGVKDVVTRDEIIDVKFGKAMREVQPDWRVQGLVYTLAGSQDMTWHTVGWPKRDGTCSYHTPSDSPGLRFERSYERYGIATDLVRSVVDAIMAYTRQFGVDAPWPANLAHSYACDYCHFRRDGSCSWWHRPIKAEDLV